MVKMTRVSVRHAVATGLLLCCAVAQAAPEATLEERLREQLRSTTQQLQTLQSSQSRILAERNTLQSQVDAAKKEVSALKTELNAAKTQGQALADSQEETRQAAEHQVAQSQQQLEKFRSAYDELLQLAKGKEAERVTLQKTMEQTSQTLAVCQQKNQRLYTLGKEILAAYEGLGTGSIIKMRQPFADASRVKFDEIAQGYGDQLYENRADAQSAANPTGDAALQKNQQE